MRATARRILPGEQGLLALLSAGEQPGVRHPAGLLLPSVALQSRHPMRTEKHRPGLFFPGGRSSASLVSRRYASRSGSSTLCEPAGGFAAALAYSPHRSAPALADAIGQAGTAHGRLWASTRLVCAQSQRLSVRPGTPVPSGADAGLSDALQFMCGGQVFACVPGTDPALGMGTICRICLGACCPSWLPAYASG